MKTFTQVNCSGKSARRGRLYLQKTGKGLRPGYDPSAKPMKPRALELVLLVKG